MRGRHTWKWLCVVLLVMFAHHTLLAMTQDVFPYSDTFGRPNEMKVTGSLLPVQLKSSTIAVLNGDVLQAVTLAEAGIQSTEHLNIPDSSVKQADQIKITAEGLIWKTAGQLKFCPLTDQGWGQTQQLGETEAFDAVEHKGQLLLINSDDKQVKIANWNGERLSAWYPIDIQDVTHVQAKLVNDQVYVASMADYGSSGKAIWWTIWDPSNEKLVMQTRIHSFQVNAGRTIQNFELGTDSSFVYIFHRDQTKDGRDSRLYLTSFPREDIKKIITEELRPEIGTSTEGETPKDGRNPKVKGGFRQLSAPVTEENGELEAIAAAGEQILLLHFKEGKKTAEKYVANGDSVSQMLLLTNPDSGTHTAVWQEKQRNGKVTIAAASDDPGYKQQTNHLRAGDILYAIGQLPESFWGIVFALAASIKWLVLPYLYIWIVHRFAEGQTGKKSWIKSTAWVSVLLYLLVKTLYISQFYNTETVPFMPEWMLSIESHFLLMLVISLISLFLSGYLRKRREETSAGLRFSKFAGYDILISVLWYGFFIR